MSTRYLGEPQNLTVEQVLRSGAFRPAVLELLRDPLIGRMFVDGSIPWAKLLVADGDIPWDDLLVADGSIPWAKLLVADGDIPAAKVAEPLATYAIARRSTTQTISKDTITAISFDTEVADTAGMFTPTSALITCQVAGLYTIVGQTSWALNAVATTRMVTFLRLNGTTTIATDERVASTSEGEGQNVAVTIPLAVGNTIELGVFQTNGGAVSPGNQRTIATSTHWPRLSVTRVGRAS